MEPTVGLNNVKKSKKRSRNPENYTFNVIKKARVKGNEYANNTGRVIPPRQTGPSCRYIHKCFEEITEEQQTDLLHHFSTFNTKDEQDIFLSGLITVVDIQRRRARENSIVNKPKSASYKFNIKINSKQTQVCKKAFVSLFGISERRVRRLQTMLLQGQSPHDMRGIGNKNRALPPVIVKTVHDHIASFPVYTSHYSSGNHTYLDARLNVQKMFDLYKEKHPDSKVNYKYYVKYFNDNFNLRFGQPQIDTCVTCESLMVKIRSHMLNDAAKRVASAEYMVHNRRAKKFYNAMKECTDISKEDDGILGLCFDYMQNLPLPKIPVQDVFYMRQLWVNVFCITNMKTNECTFYVYHEGTARKGANEVCSFLDDYIKHHVPAEVKDLRLFSDGCIGQNKNHTMIRYCLALADSGRFEKVRRYFPFRGHSYNVCDRNFGLIKRVLRRIDRIYTVKEYVEYIVHAAKKNRFSVKLVSTDDILNFSEWWVKYYRRGGLSLESQGRHIPKSQKVSLQPTHFMYFEYHNNRADHLLACDYIGGVANHKFNLRIPGTHVNFSLQKAYGGPVTIKLKKMLDIRRLIGYIPSEHSEFYEEILQLPTVDDTED